MTRVVSAIVVLLVGCAGSPGAAAGSDASLAAVALVAAEPAAWRDRAGPVLAHGAPIAGDLVAALRGNPSGPGRQIAIAVLGELGSEVALPLLDELLADRDDQIAAEAALALGRIGDPSRRSALRAIVEDRWRDVLVRTSAAAALLDLGESELAPEFLAAVLTAATPEGVPARERLHLPDRDRWAHERYIALSAIERRAGHAFGLHPDSSWPELVRGASTFLEHTRGAAR